VFSGDVRGRPIRILLFSDVDFRGVHMRERRIRELANAYRPDLVLVAGDFLEAEASFRDKRRLDEAARFLESLPAVSGRFLVPGEEEAERIRSLRSAWSGRGVDVLTNESRSITVGDQHVELFGALPSADALPWYVGSDRKIGGYLAADGRYPYPPDGIMWASEAIPESFEATFAFEAVTEDAYLDFRFDWTAGVRPDAGTGYRITRHEDKGDWRLYATPASAGKLHGVTASGFHPPAEAWCRARVRVEREAGTTKIKARFWRDAGVEPDIWMIDAWSDAPARPKSGSFGFGGRFGDRRYADLEIRDAGGAIVVRERFESTGAVRARWKDGSALGDWLTASRSMSGPRILLAHDPDVASDAACYGAKPSLIVAGHTHGGQVRIPFVGSLWPPLRIGSRYSRGLADFRGIPLYVTSGVGSGAVPIRLFCRPEITRIELTPRDFQDKSSENVKIP
jgi:predicted MPP superfamily phosphohydrolase